ncbi:MAG TPA: hypothetical protein VGR35_02035 [Tepidisphaeraceae bacterium]|nr:hypothetical protein [Tepidisphaeraceae bacterium]
MRQSYFPSTDSGMVPWARNMSEKLAADYAAYGITQQQSDEFAGLTEAYAEAYRAANVPGIRSSAATAVKNDARESLKTAARLIVSIVRGQASVTDAQKILLGITVPAPRRRAIPRPEHAPTLYVRSVTGRTVRILLADSQVHGSRSKPSGARAAMVFTAAGEKPPQVGTSGWHFHTTTGRRKCDVTFPADLAPGTRVWLTAAWVNSRNQPGPACMPIETHLQFGPHVQLVTSLARAA